MRDAQYLDDRRRRDLVKYLADHPAARENFAIAVESVVPSQLSFTLSMRLPNLGAIAIGYGQAIAVLADVRAAMTTREAEL